MGIIQKIINKYKEAKQKSLNKKEFREILLQAVSDGKLTKEEIDYLDEKKAELGLTDDDIKGIRAEIYAVAFSVAKEDQQITEEEEKELEEIQKYLGLADDEIQTSKKELARLRLLNEIQKGNLPTVPVTNLVMEKGEKAYWAEPAILMEVKVINRRYEGGWEGVSFRIMKGVSYRVGGYRGHIVSETGLVPVRDGELVITSNRIIFRGDVKAFAIKLDKILDIQIFTDGLKFTENNKSIPRIIKFKQQGNYDIVGAVLSYAINHYGDKE